MSLRLVVRVKLEDETAKIIAPLRDKPIENLPDLLKRLTKLQQRDRDFVVSPDVEEFIQQRNQLISLLSGRSLFLATNWVLLTPV